MGLNNFILTCEKDNEELRKDINYYKNMTSRLKKEKQELKQKYLNAVSDYETTMAEKEQLNSLVNSCQEEIRQLKKQLEIGEQQYNDLVEEKESLQEQLSSNTLQLEELKKQIEEYIRTNLKLKNELFNKRKEYQETYKDVRIEIKEYKTQQKEFIKYLEEEIEACKITNCLIYNHEREMKILETVLQKYKEIIGVSDEKEN